MPTFRRPTILHIIDTYPRRTRHTPIASGGSAGRGSSASGDLDLIFAVTEFDHFIIAWAWVVALSTGPSSVQYIEV